MISADQRASQMWTLFEPVHVVTYFSPEARAAFEGAGLRGFWRGYFAGRAAPLGAVTAAPVAASFYVFAPHMVSRALPAVWDLVTPHEALAVRQAGAVAALRRLLGGLDDDIARAADLLARAVADVDCSGRVLAGANAALNLAQDPVARLWQAATVLREHRGDGHFAAMLAAGVDGCEATVLRCGIDMDRSMMQAIRGWADDEWDAAAGRLAERGLLTDDGRATPYGVQLQCDVEQATNLAASRVWANEDFAQEVALAMTPVALACAMELAYPNPVGVPAPDGVAGAGL